MCVRFGLSRSPFLNAWMRSSHKFPFFICCLFSTCNAGPLCVHWASCFCRLFLWCCRWFSFLLLSLSLSLNLRTIIIVEHRSSLSRKMIYRKLISSAATFDIVFGVELRSVRAGRCRRRQIFFVRCFHSALLKWNRINEFLRAWTCHLCYQSHRLDVMRETDRMATDAKRKWPRFFN